MQRGALHCNPASVQREKLPAQAVPREALRAARAGASRAVRAVRVEQQQVAWPQWRDPLKAEARLGRREHGAALVDEEAFAMPPAR